MKTATYLALTVVGMASAQAQELPLFSSSNFDRNARLEATQVSPDSGIDPLGAFRFICNVSHHLYDDPIVYPGFPGKSHLHTFFGNEKASAFSTYESLRKEGEGTCPGGPLNRSAYWMPAMMNGFSRVVVPDFVVIYYKGEPNRVRTPPRGLRMIFGFDVGNRTGPLGSIRGGWPEKPQWLCGGGTKFNTIPADCPASEQIIVQIASPQCWDGKNLDSANHRSHMAYKKYDNNGQYRCPRTHPVELPQFSLQAFYTQGMDNEAKDWFLASDRISGIEELPSGMSFHTDWFGAWDDEIMQAWMDGCIHGHRSCNDGSLGTGIRLKPIPYTSRAIPRLIDPPQAPSSVAPAATYHGPLAHPAPR